MPDEAGGATRPGEQVLVVDDERPIRTMLQRVLAHRGFEVEAVEDATAALRELATGRYAALVTDMRMPGLSGRELLDQALRKDPDLVVIVITGVPDMQGALEALRAGASDFLAKPLNFDDLTRSLRVALDRRTARLQSARYQEQLESQVQVRTAELREALAKLGNANTELRSAYRGTIDVLKRAVAFRDNETGRHTERIGMLAGELANALGLPQADSEMLVEASALHDIGKIAVPDAILHKPGKLTPEEFELVKMHTILGAQIIGDPSAPVLSAGRDIVLSHHEKWDGTGYPNGLAGTDIPLFARIVAVVDVWDALTHARVYKPAFSFEKAAQIIRDGKGTHFDPNVAQLFLDRLDTITALQTAIDSESGGEYAKIS